MKQAIRILLSQAVLLFVFMAAGPVVGVSAQAPDPNAAAAAAQLAETKANLCSGSNLEFSDGGAVRSCNNAGDPQDKINTLVTQIVNVFSIIVGIVAVIMIIYGGFRYITSGGDSGAVSSAKNTILYAIVGLIIVALAQFVVKFVLNKATK